MSDRTAFMQKICECPEDDTARLVFADWLEEYGGESERAEFIRVQVESARVDEMVQKAAQMMLDEEHKKGRELFAAAPGTPLWNLRRQHELLTPPRRTEWAGDGFRPLIYDHIAERTLYDRRDLPEHCIEFNRGFVHQVTCESADWLTHCDQIFWHPSQTVMCGYKCNIPPWCGKCRVNGFPTGRIPRPCPETAQPITRVVLTTVPEGEFLALEALRNWVRPPRLGDHVLDCWHAEWPGVDFVLPAHQPA